MTQNETVSIDPKELYDGLRAHVGHKVAINDVWDWTTNRETSMEARCTEPACALSEPLFEIELPKRA